jgi:hypothetical protein
MANMAEIKSGLLLAPLIILNTIHLIIDDCETRMTPDSISGRYATTSGKITFYRQISSFYRFFLL